jgi:hypothetical protein
MAILQISRIQHRRGLQQDLPQLASAELGWSIDTRKLYIGNGGIDEGAPIEGVTEVLTENSILGITNLLSGLDNRLSAVENGVVAYVTRTLTSSGSVQGFSANNIVISYVFNQGSTQRQGVIKGSRYASGSTVSWDDEYTQTADTDLALGISGNSSYMSLDYSTITATSFVYNVTSIA